MESDVEVAVLVRVDLHVIDTVGIVGDHVALHERTGHALGRGRLAILHLEGVDVFRSKVVASLHSDVIDTARLEVDGRREEPVVVATLVVVRANDHTDATSIEVAPGHTVAIDVVGREDVKLTARVEIRLPVGLDGVTNDDCLGVGRLTSHTLGHGANGIDIAMERTSTEVVGVVGSGQTSCHDGSVASDDALQIVGQIAHRTSMEGRRRCGP